MKALEAYSLFVIVLEATSAQFLEQPNTGILFAPVEYEVTLTCSVEEGYLIDWHVSWSNGDEADASNGIARRVLMERGFTLKGVVTTRSTLSLQETEDEINNGTNITCLAQETSAQRALITGNVIQVLFYAGAPPPPTNLRVAEDGQDALNISWSLMVIEGAPVNYTLSVLNLNTTSAQPIIIAGLLDQHYVLENSRPCDVYSFTVTAVTAAGNSTPSQEIIFTRNGNSEICTTTTSEISSTQQTTASTFFSLPTTQTDSTQPLTTSSSPTQNNSTTILIAAVSIAFAVLMIVNVIICVFCYKKSKTEAKSDLKNPVYEAPYDIPMLPPLAENRGTPFAMTSSSAYDATGDTQKVPPKDLSPSKSSKFDTTGSYVPFAMKSSSAYEMSKKPHKLPVEVCKNLSPSKSSKNPGTEDIYVPFVMTSSLAYEISEDSQHLDTEDKSILTTMSTDDEPSKSADSASDIVPFTMTSSLAYEVSKNHKNLDCEDEIIPTALPSANELSASDTVPFIMTSSLAYEVSKNCKNFDSEDEIIPSPSANELSEKLNTDVPFIMTLSSAYEVSKNCDSNTKISSTVSPSADKTFKKLDTEDTTAELFTKATSSKNWKNLDSDDKNIPTASPSADECSKNIDIEGSTIPGSSTYGVFINPQKHPAKSPDNST